MDTWAAGPCEIQEWAEHRRQGKNVMALSPYDIILNLCYELRVCLVARRNSPCQKFGNFGSCLVSV